jgi:hypothetical protein
MSLTDKIKKIEALLAGAKTEGERQAATLARERLLGKQKETPLEYSIRTDSYWKKQLFLAICQKHQLYPYRYARQKRTTTMVRAQPSLMQGVIWPEFQKYSDMLEELVKELMDDLISKIHTGIEEERVIVGELPHVPDLDSTSNF